MLPVRSSITPLGVSPPLLTTATRASATCRSPASPRSCVTASWIRPMPCVRPWDSWPPWVLSGITPSRAICCAAVEEVLGLADAAEAQRLQPRQAVEREPVVQLGDVDIAGPQRGSGPQVRGLPEHLRLVGQRGLIPVECAR